MISKIMRVVFFISMAFTFVFYSHPVFAGEPLTLEASVEIALKNSITLNIAKEESKSAVARKKEAFTGFLPKFSTSYRYTRLNEEPFSRFQGIPPGLLSSMNGLEIPAGTKDNYTWAIDVKQPLFAGGGILANYQASRIGEDVAFIEEKAKYQDVVLDVKNAYFNVLRTQKIQEVALQSVEMLTAHRDVAQNYFNVGMIPKNDLLYAEVELANGKQSLITAQNALEMTKYNFNKILKRDMFVPVEIVDTLTYQPLQQSLAECLNVARQARPELQIASLRAAQAGKLVKLAQSDYFPALNLVGNYERFGDHSSVDGSNYKDAESWYFMAAASWNIWEWGKTKFNVDASKAKEKQAIDANRELDDQVDLDVTNAYLRLQEAENRILVSRKVIEQAEENFRISEERYKERVSTSTEVLDAQTLLRKAKSEYANALTDFNISYAKLQRAMGTIWGSDEDQGRMDKENVKTNEAGPGFKEENVKARGAASAYNSNSDQTDARAGLPAAAVNPVPISNEQKAEKSNAEEDIQGLINRWLASWQSGDMEAYRDCYASDFKSQRKNLQAWVSYKTLVRQKHKDISIRIENLKISFNARTSTAKAIFTQYYSSSILKDQVVKKLKLRKVNGEWKIYKETLGR